ncbi:flagellin [Citreimonas salinaria]|uniref:Flagellin n=2 Tax=Citreimonas salinaria TaxID=321339 RepID=A0A1H3EXM9_9RHOB|nr:flagellin [Citreimonas salinaria]SDX82729.1 flagellin [Citreimonas salinaria]
MSSILTNNGAMVALQTLKSINKNLEGTQNSIATGKNVATSKDNAAVWAISKVMESDVSGFKAISSNLGLGQATTQVARQAAETTTDLLKQMKEKIVASQEGNVDRTKIQTDIKALTDQIASVTGAAQFNGLNLLSNNETTTAYTAAGSVEGSGTTSVLSSLDRSATGVVASDIDVQKQDLSTTAAKDDGALTLAAAALTAAGTAGANGTGSATYTINGETTTAGRTQAVMAGDSYSFQMNAVFGGSFATAPAAKQEAVYTAKDGDTQADVAEGLAEMMKFRLAEQGMQDDFTVSVGGTNGNEISVTNHTATGLTASAAGNVTLAAGSTVGGGLALLSELDVTTENGAAAALSAIEGLIQTGIDAAAAFGSAQNRIETQQDFVGGLMDAMKSGIGTLVDADMEEQSARLQALQVQQQLGVQALSIANQAPQQLLSLFR